MADESWRMDAAPWKGAQWSHSFSPPGRDLLFTTVGYANQGSPGQKPRAFFLSEPVGLRSWVLPADQRGIEPPPAVCQRHKSAAIPTAPRGRLDRSRGHLHPPHDAAMLAGSSPHTGGYYNQPFVRIHISGSKLICTRLDGHVLCISSSRPTCVYQQSYKTIPSATCQHRNCLVRRQWCWRCLSTAVIKKQIIRSMAQKEVRATNLCKLHTRVLSDVLFPSSRLVNFASSYGRSNSWKSDTTKAHTQTALSCGSSSSLDSYRIFQPRKNMLDDFFSQL